MKKMFNKKSLKSLVVLVITLSLIIVIGCWFYTNVFNKPYSVVSTISGEFYVGKLSHLPFSGTLKLTNAFILQNVKASATDAGSLQLIPLSQSLWQPRAVYFNIDNVVFSGRVGADSQVAKTIATYESGTPAPNQQPAAPVVK